MEEKLQTYSSKDTECPNHNTWMISCKLTFLFSAWSESHESWAAMPPKVMVLIKIYQFQVPDHDELLGKWPRCETNIYWFKKSAERHGNPAQGETCDEHNNLWLSFRIRENENLAACSLQISNDLFRCPKSTHLSLLIGIILISVSFVSCHRGSTTGIFENFLSRVLFSIEYL